MAGRMSDTETKEFQDFIRAWALMKMRKQEKKLCYYASIYFGEPVAIVYARNGAKVIHNGTEGEVSVSEE